LPKLDQAGYEQHKDESLENVYAAWGPKKLLHALGRRDPERELPFNQNLTSQESGFVT